MKSFSTCPNAHIDIKKTWFECQSFDDSDNFDIYQQVKEGSRADTAGLKLGDSIVTINDTDTGNMTLQQANNVLEQAAQQNVNLGVIKWVLSNKFLN